jgi:maltose O-acetyltransferase
MPGVIVGEGAIILAGSVVTHNIPSYEVWGGNPARKVRMRVKNINYKINYNYLFAL